MAADAFLSKSKPVFYVYLHRRASDGTVFYVGKGSGRRAWRRQNRNPHWQNIVAKHGLQVEIAITGLAEDEAFAREVETIARFGRDNLCNLSDGGEGPTGHVVSESKRLAVSRAHKGKKRPPEWCEAISESLKGRSLSPKAREKISLRLKGRPLSAETRRAMSRARLGKPQTAEHRANNSKAWADPIAKARRAEAMALASEGTAIICADTGQRFEKINHALTWLRERHPKASHSSLVRSCKNPAAKAYGYRWRYAD